jgi:phage terminase large subunit-like protein
MSTSTGRKPIPPEKILELIPTFFKHTRGEWEGMPFSLMPWQTDLILKVFGNLDDEGYRRYRKVFVSIPKKSGKSEFGALLALWMLLFDKEASAEVYSAASDRDQASIVFNVAVRMVEMSPELSERCTIIRSRKTITNRNNGVYRVLSSEHYSKHGFSPSCVIFDELHAQQDRQLYDALSEGAGAARRQPLTVYLTTSGWDKTTICYEVLQYAEAVVSGAIVDPTFLPILYGVPAGADISLEETWRAANPAMDIIIRLEDFRNDYNAAMRSPAAENNFKRLRLNMWTDSQSRWLPSDKYDERAHGTPIDERELRGKACYGGLDLSSVNDLSAFTLCFPPPDAGGQYLFLHRFWIPSENMVERIRRDRVPYDAWNSAGWVMATPGDVIDYAAIKMQILKDSEDFNIVEVAFDPYNSTGTTQQLQDAGLVMAEFRQGFRTMSPAAKQFEAALLGGKLNMGQHPVMKWMSGNVEILTDPAGNIKPVKPSKDSVARIDGIISSIMALDRAMKHVEPVPSVYNERGLIVL